MSKFRDKLQDLYHGSSSTSVHFRFGLIAFDFVTISFFIVTSMVELSPWIITVDFIIAFFAVPAASLMLVAAVEVAGEFSVFVHQVPEGCGVQLFQVGQAGGGFCRVICPAQGGEGETENDGNDSDND